ncbi:MAG: hypothetical protein WCD79_21220 [Chthoniobacteraceae bacterium]
MARNGKIARLPYDLREKINFMLQAGLTAKIVLEAINGMPKVKELLDKFFLGNSLTEQNITNWRQGGYQEWLVGRDAKSVVNQMREEAMCLNSEALVGGGPITDTLATVMAARYATIIAKLDLNPQADVSRELEVFRNIIRDIRDLRKGDHTATRLRQREARLVMDAVHKNDHIVTQFRKWMTQDKLWTILGGEYTHPDAYQRLYHFILGPVPDPKGFPPEDLDPNSPWYVKPAEGATPENQGKSSQIKPDAHKKQSGDPFDDSFGG